MAENGNGFTNTKAAAAYVAAIVGAMAAVFIPMQTQISALKDSQEKIIDKGINQFGDDRIKVAEQLASQRVQFTEVETQFRGVKETVQGMSALIDSRLATLDKMLQHEIKTEADRGDVFRDQQAANVEVLTELRVRLAVLESKLEPAELKQ